MSRGVCSLSISTSSITYGYPLLELPGLDHQDPSSTFSLISSRFLRPWIDHGSLSGHRTNEILEESEMQICYDQPHITPFPRVERAQSRPSTSYSKKSHVSTWVASGRDLASRASSRASQYTIARPGKSHSRQRPSIGRPMDFKHNDGIDGSSAIQSMLDDAPMPIRRRRSFRPLELSIYLPDGRLSPLPDFEDNDWVKKPAEAFVRNVDSRTNSIASSPPTPSYLVQRKPVGSGSRRSSMQSQSSARSRPLSGAFATLPFLPEEPRGRPDSIINSTPSSLQRARTHDAFSPNRLITRVASPSRSRASTAPSRPGSIRKGRSDVEDAIRELNTIVEERRADAYRSANYAPSFSSRPPPSPSSHVPAIAPSLRMKVRSETLSDIGSAFSVPYTSKPLPAAPLPSSPKSSYSSSSRGPRKLYLLPPSRQMSGPLDSNPITPPTPTVPEPTTPIHRLGAWLKRSLPTTPSSPAFLKNTPPSSSATRPSTAKSTKSQTSPTRFYSCESSPHEPTSRPSTAGSNTLVHTRHASNDSNPSTLLSSFPSTPSLTSASSHRSLSPDLIDDVAPATPARVSVLKGEGKTRRVPPPLRLVQDSKKMSVELALGSARSVASFQSMASTSTSGGRSSRRRSSLKPPPSPHYGLLRGMEISARDEGVLRSAERVLPSPGAVGVAF